MLLVIPERKNPDGSLMTLVMPYESATLKPGAVRFHNASDKRLAMQFETAEGKVLPIPNNTAIDFLPSAYTDRLYPRIYIYDSEEGGKPMLRHSSRLKFEAEKYNFFIVYPHGRHRLRILRLGGHVDPEAVSEVLREERPARSTR